MQVFWIDFDLRFLIIVLGMISSANTRIGEVGHVTISSSLFGTSRQCKLTLKALVDADGTTTAGGAAGELLLRLVFHGLHKYIYTCKMDV